ncbi:LamB/YcsF family protein [Clostridium ganghwense]|uniref:5-oxoprolinase subunit A n=1 Tax=Clostridium ganghwense TaxID=312089 RepID=A0ABT4CJG2_9CLOT|nr:5-oxoprolinase subunit PxpA [Clostridium ganghwense]MCY6369189.1 LamB/YcsF family protein [Clostridium ganghwense]
MYKVDLNCDMGESFGAYKIGNDEEILQFITSANIACGFHGGDPSVMNKTVKLALEKNVAVGAHVGFQDLVGFGRRNMHISPREVYDITVYQIGALYGFVKAYGGRMNHVKPHGSLYNMAARSEELSRAIVEAVYKVNPELILFGLSGSKLVKEGQKVGIKVANEVFADRTYTDKGTLTPRKEENALIDDRNEASKQVIRMIKDRKVISASGNEIDIKADTICIHGDGEHALAFARRIRDELKNNDIIIKSI